MAEENSGATAAFWLLGGAVLGAAAAFLIAPRSGREMRGQLAEAANKGGRALTEQGQDVLRKGRELYERGRDLADEAAERFERARGVAEKKVNEAV